MSHTVLGNWSQRDICPAYQEVGSGHGDFGQLFCSLSAGHAGDHQDTLAGIGWHEISADEGQSSGGVGDGVRTVPPAPELHPPGSARTEAHAGATRSEAETFPA